MILIGTEVFRTKEAARQRCRDLLQSLKPGQIVTEPQAVDFLWSLLLLHPSVKEKIGVGVSWFFVSADAFGGQRFCVRRVDGVTEHFSYLKCLRQPTTREQVSSAMRAEVTPQVLEFKHSTFNGQQSVACALTGGQVDWYGAHVDHYDPEFWQLRDGFLNHERVSPERVLLADALEGGKCLADRQFAARWSSFHESFAKLRVVTKAANLARARER